MPITKYEASDDYGKEPLDNPRLVPPDGGWGWAIVFGGFISMMLASLPMTGFGLLFSPLLMSQGVSSTKVSWIFNVYMLIWNLFALLIGPLSEEYGWRKVAFWGGILNFLSLVGSGFAPHPEFLFFSFSVLGGIGSSIGVTTSLIVVSRYFEKRRGFALGITAIGMCASAFVSPLLSTFLLDKYEYMGAISVFGAVVLNQCVGACLFQPVELHMKRSYSETIIRDYSNSENEIQDYEIQEKLKKRFNTRRMSEISVYSFGSYSHSVVGFRGLSKSYSSGIEITDDSIKTENSFLKSISRILAQSYNSLKYLKYLRVIIIAVGNGCLMLGCNNFQMWVPFVVMNAGYPLHMAAWCVSAASIANAIGKICMSSLSDRRRFNVRIAYMVGNLFIGLFIIGFAYAEDIVFFLILICGWGFNIGNALSLNPTVMIDVMGVDLFPSIFGVSSWSIAIFGIVLGPIIGAIRDATGSYKYALSVLGGLEIFAFVLWTLMPLATKYDNERIRRDLDRVQF